MPAALSERDPMTRVYDEFRYSERRMPKELDIRRAARQLLLSFQQAERLGHVETLESDNTYRFIAAVREERSHSPNEPAIDSLLEVSRRVDGKTNHLEVTKYFSKPWDDGYLSPMLISRSIGMSVGIHRATSAIVREVAAISFIEAARNGLNGNNEPYSVHQTLDALNIKHDFGLIVSSESPKKLSIVDAEKAARMQRKLSLPMYSLEMIRLESKFSPSLHPDDERIAEFKEAAKAIPGAHVQIFPLDIPETLARD